MIAERQNNHNALDAGNFLSTGPYTLSFNGNSMSLITRLENMTSQQLSYIHDASIRVTGRQIQTFNQTSVICTAIWGSLFIFPLCFTYCDWWKSCTYSAYDIHTDVYISLSKILSSPLLRNLTLVITDNCFDHQKADILFDLISTSNLTGFTFINLAGNYDFRRNQYQSFEINMLPIARLHNLSCDIRWHSKVVQDQQQKPLLSKSILSNHHPFD